MTTEIYLKNAERTPIFLAGDWRVVNFLNLALPQRVRVSCREYAEVVKMWMRIGELLDQGFVEEAQELYDRVYYGPFGCLLPSRYSFMEPRPGEPDIDSTERKDIDALLARMGFDTNAGKMVARVVCKRAAKGDGDWFCLNVRLGLYEKYVEAHSLVGKTKADFIADWKYQVSKLEISTGVSAIFFNDVVARLRAIGWEIDTNEEPQEGIEWME